MVPANLLRFRFLRILLLQILNGFGTICGPISIPLFLNLIYKSFIHFISSISFTHHSATQLFAHDLGP